MSLAIEKLLDKRCFAHDCAELELIETHISWVILTGEFAYKIKKPVSNAFLDFSSLAQRKYYCEQELMLNRQFAPQLYLELVGVYETPAGPQFAALTGSDQQPLEYAVKMRQFPASTRLDKLLENGQLSEQDMDTLAVSLANTHMKALTHPDARHGGDPNDRSGEAEQIVVPALENFREIVREPPLGSDATKEAAIELWTLQQGKALKATFAQRKAEGRIRVCHGDLHLQNLCKFDGEILAFDCMEFNPQWRHIDVINEVSFLFVDLLARGRQDLAYRFLNTYLEYSGDYDGLSLLWFYACYRAMVRAKVIAIRLQQSPSPSEKQRLLDDYRHYIDLAESCTQQQTAAILAMCGLSGSGKSTIAQKLMQTLPAIRVRSDTERKRQHFFRPDEDCSSSIRGGIYSAAASAQVYAELEHLAATITAAGHTVILDAAFLQQQQRDSLRDCARKLNRPLLFVLSTASTEKLEQRIVERQSQRRDVSDADVLVLRHQLKAAQLPTERENSDTISINTEELTSEAQIISRVRKALSFTR